MAEERLVPAFHDYPAQIGWLCEDPTFPYTFEEEIGADECGACAIHMSWSEPWEYVTVLTFDPPIKITAHQRTVSRRNERQDQSSTSPMP